MAVNTGATMITFDQFIAEHQGRLVDVDGAYAGQCWDLVAAYDQEVIGVPGNVFWGLPAGPDGYAREVYQYFPDPLPKYYDKLPLSATPQKGDVVVWGAGPGDEPGHIAIFVSGSLQNFTSFDQNWPLGSAPHMQNHNANYVIGFLRPKGDIMADFEDVKFIKYGMLHRLPSEAEVKGDVGQKTDILAKTYMQSEEWQTQNEILLNAYPKALSQINDLKAQTGNSSEANLLGQALIKLLATFGYKKS